MVKIAKKYELKAVGEDSGFPQTQITHPHEAVEFARQFYGDDIDIFESAFIMLMNRANKVTGWAKISQGGLHSTVVDPIVVCKYAVDTLAAGVILIHNHPSGNAHPGTEDIMLTKKLRDALKMLDVELHDSIVITNDSSCSIISECMI